MHTLREADVAVVGAGIAGLAHAYEAVRRGLSVVVFERDAHARSASVRNFGMILPLGMAPGTVHARALRSREVWLDLAPKAGFWHAPVGALFLAYQADEWDVLRDFAEQGPGLGYRCELLDPVAVQERSPAVRSDGLQGGLWSPAEVIVDPREAVNRLTAYLADVHGVLFRFGHAVTAIDLPRVVAGGEVWQVQRAVVCSGADFETLYPGVLHAGGLTRCKLQMMRTVAQPEGWRLGPMLAAGPSLCHYPAFSRCAALEQVRTRLQEEHPALVRWGIHVMACQNGRGELTLGDSHEYGLAPSPFDRVDIDEEILAYLRTFLRVPTLQVARRWHGVYARHPEQAVFQAAPAPDVRIVTGFGGTGMTTAFGMAQEVFDAW